MLSKLEQGAVGENVRVSRIGIRGEGTLDKGATIVRQLLQDSIQRGLKTINKNILSVLSKEDENSFRPRQTSKVKPKYLHRGYVNKF